MAINRLTDMGFFTAKQGVGRYVKDSRIKILIHGDFSYIEHLSSIKKDMYSEIIKIEELNENAIEHRYIRKCYNIKDKKIEIYLVMKRRKINEKIDILQKTYITDPEIILKLKEDKEKKIQLKNLYTSEEETQIYFKEKSKEIIFPRKDLRELLDCMPLQPILKVEGETLYNGKKMDCTQIFIKEFDINCSKEKIIKLDLK